MTAHLDAVAAHGLVGSTAALPDEALPDAAFDTLLRAVGAERLTGHLVAAIRSGALPVTDRQSEQASEAHFDAVCSWLLLESTMLQVLDVLAAACVDVRVVKGPAVAHLDYPEPGLRGFGDVDLLVRSEDIDAATSSLRAAGYRRLVPEPRHGFDRRFGKGATFQAPGGHEVDLHRTFVMGAFGLLIATDELWDHGDRFVVGGRTVVTLDAECRLLQACYNVMLGDETPRLTTLRDIAQLLLSTEVDTSRVRELARGWRGESVLAGGIALAWRTLQLADALQLSEWARRHQRDKWSASMFATYGPGVSYAAKSWAAVRTMERTRDRLAFLLSLAFPADGELGGQRRSLVSRARSATEGWRAWADMT